MGRRPAAARVGRSFATAAAFATLAGAGPLAAEETEVRSLENAVKATYLYKLAPFVQWPRAVAPSADFNLCIAGNGPFGPLLDNAVRGQSVGGRPIAVRRFLTVANDSGCQIMYVAGSPAQSVAQILEVLRGTPVLTVTDGQSNPRDKGIINFVLVAGHVRFEIDEAAAAAGGLALSSKLVSLAVNERRP